MTKNMVPDTLKSFFTFLIRAFFNLLKFAKNSLTQTKIYYSEGLWLFKLFYFRTISLFFDLDGSRSIAFVALGPMVDQKFTALEQQQRNNSLCSKY
jgi:hypothetical protein